MNPDQIKEITDRLDTLIRIISIQSLKEEDSPIDQVNKLSSLGMATSEIGKILGKPTKTISAYMVRIKERKSNG